MNVVDFNKDSLLTRISRAKTAKAIQRLLKEGKTYKYASQKTRNKWKNAAETRIDSFEG